MRKVAPALTVLLLSACTPPPSKIGPPPARIVQSLFGRMPDGTEVHLYTLTNSRGMVARVMTYGALLTELHAPDRAGTMGDIALGFDNLGSYLKEHPYFGATIGRVANRIAKGVFTLDGKRYKVATNNGPNHLHGGRKGFDKVVWRAVPVPVTGGAALKLSYTSPDGEEGFPGALSVTVTYTLTDGNELHLDYTATTDRPTPVNLTNHSYWNLAGAGDILGHTLTVAADRYTPVDDTLIPTGAHASVKGTPMDFTTPMTVGSRIEALTNTPRGYDHNYVLNSGGGTLSLAVRLAEPRSGRVMEIWTTEPGIQLYSGNFLDGTLTGKRGVVYKQYSGLVLEADHFPDSINRPSFPSVILRPGQTYTQRTVYKLSAK
jgi:aldose 1-epimerase